MDWHHVALAGNRLVFEHTSALPRLAYLDHNIEYRDKLLTLPRVETSPVKTSLVYGTSVRGPEAFSWFGLWIRASRIGGGKSKVSSMMYDTFKYLIQCIFDHSLFYPIMSVSIFRRQLHLSSLLFPCLYEYR